MDIFEEAVFRTAVKYRLFNKEGTVLVALSGGPDSVALLLALWELRTRLGLKVEAAHVNHLLRGVESDQDEEFVRSLCATLGIPVHVSRIETRRQATEHRQNLEESARLLRYGFLLSVAVRMQATVATGHTRNDLDETFLLKLFRGAGISGLAGIYPRRCNRLEDGAVVDVVRPLIESTRSDILEYLGRRKQAFREDSSNRDLSFDRNLVRHELMPLLESRLNPGVTGTLARTASLFRELEDFLSPLLDERYERCRERAADAPVSLRLSQLLVQHPFVQKEIVRRALREYRGDLKDVSYRHVEDVLKIAGSTSGAECHLGSGVRVRHEFDLLKFGAERTAVHFEYELSLPGDVYISEVRKRVTGRFLAGRVAVTTAAPGSILLSFAGSRLRVRNRRPGDRYRMGAFTRKLKEILIERKIPRSLRDELLIFEDGREILWVEGFDPPAEFRPRTGDGPVLEIGIEHETFPR